MKTVAIIALLVLVCAVQCRKNEVADKSGFFDSLESAWRGIWGRNTSNNTWNSQGTVYSNNTWNHSWSNSSNHTWNSSGIRFEEETVTAPVKKSVISRIRDFGGKLWNRLPRPFQSKKVEASAFFNSLQDAWNGFFGKHNHTHHNHSHHNHSHHHHNHSHHHHHHNHSHHNHSCNRTNHTSRNFRLEEVTVQKPSFFSKLISAPKKLWNMRPWVKRVAKETSEESAQTYTVPSNNWNSQGYTFPQQPANTWNSQGYTFPQKNTTWNSQGYTFPQQNTTWNSQGYRFEEETAPVKESLLGKIRNYGKQLWNKRPFQKAQPQA